MEYFKIKRRMIELDAMLKAKMELIPFLESEDEDQVIQKELDQLIKVNPMAWLEVQ
mgnify:FL=1|jgi:hypothetical protein|tara:strand:+ start:358 stop:525 length:168 start_codon:yes stop_codon:yes gene_type:complete